MIPQKPKYFVLIVHYGEDNITHRCTTSFLQGQLLPDKIIIIDHNPQPFTVDKSHEAVCQIVRPAGNYGYGGGITLGLGVLVKLKAQPEDIVICLNNDSEAGRGLLSQLEEWWSHHPELVLAARQAMRTNLFTGRARAVAKNMPAPTSPFFLSYLDGAFLAARYDVWLRLKGIPERYFLYWEDVLLSQSARRQGIELAVVPDLLLTHVSVSSDSEQALYYLVRNGALFLEQETSFIWRQFWRLKNRLRVWWHSLQPYARRRNIIISALKAARRRQSGPYTISNL